MATTNEIREIVAQALEGHQRVEQAQTETLTLQIRQIFHDEIGNSIDEKVAVAFQQTDAKLNRRLLTAIMANAIPLIIGAFFLGGLWVRFSDVPAVLEGRAGWMVEMESRVYALERSADRTDDLYVKPETMNLPE